MERYRIEAEDVIGARPETIWDIISDYHAGHPLILPKGFGALEVERGGQGAGTIIRFWVRAGGVTRHFRQEVSTPEPGRVLVEADIIGTSATTFRITPLDAGRGVRVRITTEMDGRSGALGAVERAATRLLLLPRYREELGKLAAVAREREAGVEVSY
jgi:polyketide cyclase/dehydrase/lipid transport protein